MPEGRQWKFVSFTLTKRDKNGKMIRVLNMRKEMVTITADLNAMLQSSAFQQRIGMLYGDTGNTALLQTKRYEELGKRFFSLFPAHGEFRFFSAPGRAEIGGNHTDHQSGRVLTASIHLDTLAAAQRNDQNTVTVFSHGFPKFYVDLASLGANAKESGTAASLVRGCAKRMKELGFDIGGFDAAIVSDVLPGSGLSSSAALEILFCAIFDHLYNQGSMPPIQRAQIGQYAENNYFGKPCGLLDQMGSSFGGLVAIDFQKSEPIVETLPFDFLKHGYALAIVNTGKHHGALTDDYAAIPAEMKRVAAFFGRDRLREVGAEQFLNAIPELYREASVSDRAILRAMHFFDEDARVPAQVKALRAGDLPRFLDLINESGQSSMELLQNIYTKPSEQPLSVALALSQRLLKGKGAWRVHGGGFAGTILSFVPLDWMDAYAARMNAVFGENACAQLAIRPVGAYEMDRHSTKTGEDLF